MTFLFSPKKHRSGLVVKRNLSFHVAVQADMARMCENLEF